MIILRKIYRYTRSTQYIIFSLVSMVLFFSLMIVNIQGGVKNMLEINNQLTKNYIGIAFNSDINNDKVVNLLEKIKSKDDVIIKYYLQTGFGYDVYSEGIYFNNTFNNSYNILEGRFFNAEDFEGNNKIAVIGKNAIKYTSIENNKRYITRGLDKFEVVGIVGGEGIDSRYDSTVLYNLNAILNNNEILDKDTWYIDSNSMSMEKLKELTNEIGQSKFISIMNGNVNFPNPLMNAVENSKLLILNFLLIIVCIFITLIRSILLWIDSIALEFGVRKNYGATNKELFIEIIKRYSIISVISIFIILTLESILFKMKSLAFLNYKITFTSVFLSSIFIAIVGVVFIILFFSKISNIKINKLLRGI